MLYNSTDRQKWQRVLVADMISSDSSGMEEGMPVFVAKELSWRHSKVLGFFERLDKLMKPKSQNRQKDKLNNEFVVRIDCL